MSIINGGKHKGRKIQNLSSIRPTTARVRESMFNILKKYEIPPNFTIMDFFCGSGALAIEALSRGAGHAVLLDINTKHLALARANVAALGESAKASFVKCDVTKTIPPTSPCNLIFMDPPYKNAKYFIDKTIQNIYKNELLSMEALILIEAPSSIDSLQYEGLQTLEQRKYGNTIIFIMKLTG